MRPNAAPYNGFLALSVRACSRVTALDRTITEPAHLSEHARALASGTCASLQISCNGNGVCIDTQADWGIVPHCACRTGWAGLYCATKVDSTTSSCFNGQLDAALGETDVDCGGPRCGPCEVGLKCRQQSDCAGGSSDVSVASRSSGAVAPGRNATVICTAPDGVCTDPAIAMTGLFLSASVRLSGLQVMNFRGSMPSALRLALVAAVTGGNASTGADSSRLIIKRVQAYRNSRLLSGLRGDRSLQLADGTEVSFVYQVEDQAQYDAAAGHFTDSLASAAFTNSLISHAPGLYVTGSTVRAAPAAVSVVTAPSLQRIEDAATSGSGGDGGSNAGAVAAGIILALIVIPAAGLAGVTFLGERDASGHTWVDRLLIRRCPCCARAMLKNPVSASASATKGKKGKKGTKPVTVANPVVALLGEGALTSNTTSASSGGSSASSPAGKPAGAISGKDFLAQRKAARAAAAGGEGSHISPARDRRPSGVRVEMTPTHSVARAAAANPLLSGGASTLSTAVTSSGEVVLTKRIGAAQPHGVLVAAAKQAPVSELVKGSGAPTTGAAGGSVDSTANPIPRSPLDLSHVPQDRDSAEPADDASRSRVASFR